MRGHGGGSAEQSQGDRSLSRTGPRGRCCTIQNLSVAYGETLILRDVDLEVAPGEVVCLMGRNGVGKTTLLKSIMGLLAAASGPMSLSTAKDLTRATPDVRARAGIGYVPQGREIFPQLTVMENLQVGLLANPARPRSVPDMSSNYFPDARRACSTARAACSAAASSSSSPSPAPWSPDPSC